MCVDTGGILEWGSRSLISWLKSTHALSVYTVCVFSELYERSEHFPAKYCVLTVISDAKGTVAAASATMISGCSGG